MQTHIDTITNFIASQMDGESVPCHNSKEFDQLEQAIRAIQTDARDKTLVFLGLRALGAVIARTHSNILAQQTLQSFLRGDDRV